MAERPLNRIKPAGPVQAYQTYQAAAPHDQTVLAACRTVGCGAYLHGWDTVVDEQTDLGRRQAAYIRQQSGRSFKELRSEGGLTVFRFDAYQRCFADHRTRPARWLVRGGDWRASTGLVREHTRPDDWVEDFAEHQDRLADRLRQG
jgi:hypothetical protein